MQTSFSPAQLADPATAASEGVIRKCVHCGFCTATCPTYVLLGDERDSPRGRIYLIKQMLERDETPTAEVVKHVDRCLSCLSCMTTCPSGVNYMHLVDHARAHIEKTYKRPLRERIVRNMLAFILPHPARFRLAIRLAHLMRPLAPVGAALFGSPAKAMLALVPKRMAAAPHMNASPAAQSRERIILLQGCAEPVLRPEIRNAAVRLLNRAGYDVGFAENEVCCGALVHHMGREDESLAAARANVDAWIGEIETHGVAAIVVTASGCGTTLKDYGYMLRNDPAYAGKAARISALAVDISEVLERVELPPGRAEGVVVAYHPACSLQHGQKIIGGPKKLLAAAGFDVRTPSEAHLCCGSAGTYNLLQPEIAGRLRDRKLANIEALSPQVIATGNIGCMIQIGSRARIPVVHTVELLDWASGGPLPPAMAGLGFERSAS